MMKLEGYTFGRVRVDGVEYDRDLIVLPDGIRPNWWRKEGHCLHPEDLDAVVEAQPEVLVVGTGSSGLMRVPEETRSFLAERGIEVVVKPTAEACEEFNRLSNERRAAAALHLTC